MVAGAERRSGGLSSCVIDRARLEAPAMSQNAPGDTGQLIGERDRKNVAMQPLLGRLDLGLEPVALPALWLDQYDPRCLHEQDAQVAIATL
jgi:hypothetical protein